MGLLAGCMSGDRCSPCSGPQPPFSTWKGAEVSRELHPTSPPCGKRLVAFESLECWGVHRAPRGRPEWVEAKKREGTGSRPWSPGVIQLGQARGKRKGDGSRGGPGSREFPSSTVSPVRHPVGPRKRGLACNQTEFVTHHGLPTLDHGIAV